MVAKQVGIRVQSGQIRTLRGSSNNIQETLSKTYTNKWTFWCGYMGASSCVTAVGFADDTNLTTIVSGSHSYSTGTGTKTVGARL